MEKEPSSIDLMIDALKPSPFDDEKYSLMTAYLLCKVVAGLANLGRSVQHSCIPKSRSSGRMWKSSMTLVLQM